MVNNRNGTTTTTLSEGWRTTIDGWVRDPAIRRHGLLALAMILGTATLIVGLMTGALATAVSALLPSLLAKIIAAAGALTLGGGSTRWWLRRQARRQTAQAGP
jgi:hypothetical protein